MKSKIAERILSETPKEVQIYAKHYSDLLVRISELLKDKGISQKGLADKLDKQPSEISKWLSGDHNFTLKSIAKLEAELDETLLIIPSSNSKTEFTQFAGKVTYKVTVNRPIVSSTQKPAGKWICLNPENEYSNVG